MQRQQRSLGPRELAEQQLNAIESGYSGWFGGAGLLNYRSGNLGYDHLSALESPFEASIPIGTSARFSVVARPVFLDSGQANGNAVVSVDESTTAGSALVTIPEPLGTDVNTGASATTTAAIPAQQNAAGIGGEAQLAFPHFAVAGGYTPAGFLVATFTARAYWRPGNGPFTFSFDRDSETDSQLSYSGLRDPAGNTLATQGAPWGGVVYNYGRVQFSRGSQQSGYYIGGGGQYLSGYNVETNTRIEGSGGAYWHAFTAPEYGNLSIGVNFFGMHYANNQDAFTFGMGGYFSPQEYFLANIPFTWVGHYQTHWHYTILGHPGLPAERNAALAARPAKAPRNRPEQPHAPRAHQRRPQLRPARQRRLPDRPPLVCRNPLRRQQHAQLRGVVGRLLYSLHASRPAVHGSRAHRHLPLAGPAPVHGSLIRVPGRPPTLQFPQLV